MTRIITVGPTGRDYTTLNEAATATVAAYTDPPTDLQPWVFECDAFVDTAGGGALDTISCTADYNITLRAAEGHEHGGVVGAGYVQDRLNTVSTSHSLPAYGVARDVEFKTTGIYVGSALSLNTDVTLDRVIVNAQTADYASRNAIDVNRSGTTTRNCLILANGRGIEARDPTTTIESCTVINTSGVSTLGIVSDGDTTIKNTAIIGFASESVHGTPGTNTTNAIDDSAITAVSITSADFVDYAGGNYAPAVGGALDGAGTDLSADFTDDITGATRTQWDIGAYAIVASGGAITYMLQSATWITVTPYVLDGGSWSEVTPKVLNQGAWI